VRGTKLIYYSTPRQIQIKLRKVRAFTASKKPHNYCIKLKQFHKFVLVKKETSNIIGHTVETQEFHCAGCSKKKVNFIEIL